MPRRPSPRRVGDALALLAVAAAVSLAPAPAAAQDLDDLLLEMRIVVLDGETPPAFTLEALDGGTASLADLGGKVVVLYFWHST